MAQACDCQPGQSDKVRRCENSIQTCSRVLTVAIKIVIVLSFGRFTVAQHLCHTQVSKSQSPCQVVGAPDKTPLPIWLATISNAPFSLTNDPNRPSFQDS